MNTKQTVILNYFEQINQIPRCSGQEARIASWLRQWAHEKGFGSRSDAAGNVVIQVPAAPGFEHAPTLVLQGHMDMVCEKNPESTHDFSHDPIRMQTNGPWLTAVDTTLGADNGIAIAMALAIAENPALSHPPLELLFTVDEETGMTGAMGLDPALISGRIMINLDSEEEGLFIVGCAGGMTTTFHYPLSMDATESGYELLKVSAAGMRGGHSGIDIAKHRANANAIMARLLNAAMAVSPIRMVEMDGGTRINVIPRHCDAVLACRKDRTAAIQQEITRLAEIIKAEYRLTDPGFTVRMTRQGPVKPGCMAATPDDTTAMIHLLCAIPNGPIEMSPEFPLLVQTSTNFARVAFSENGGTLITSQRSAVPSRLQAVCQSVSAIGHLAHARVEADGAYPPWPMQPDSPLLKRCRSVYNHLFSIEPKVEIIHAGLECGVIGNHFPEMDMISIGPTIESPHSPSERLYLPSVEKTGTLLEGILASYSKA